MFTMILWTKKRFFFFWSDPRIFFFGATKMAKNRKNDASPLKGTPPVTKGRGSRFPATSQVRKLIFPDVWQKKKKNFPKTIFLILQKSLLFFSIRHRQVRFFCTWKCWKMWKSPNIEKKHKTMGKSNPFIKMRYRGGKCRPPQKISETAIFQKI